MDWGLGRYETTAEQLLPAAHVVIDRAQIVKGERVVDVGCGTGNATLLAAARGARVTGVDPAPRLLSVARDRASMADLTATFVEGEAANLPLPGASADLVVSVFGVIFAPDPGAAVSELARVTAPEGRIVFSAWIPQGAMSACIDVFQAAVMQAVGAPAPPPAFAWHDRGALTRLLAPLGFVVTLDEESLTYTAASARIFLDTMARDHPLSVAGGAVLQPDQAAAAGRRALAVLGEGNEDPEAFTVSSRYIVATARRTNLAN